MIPPGIPFTDHSRSSYKDSVQEYHWDCFLSCLLILHRFTPKNLPEFSAEVSRKIVIDKSQKCTRTFRVLQVCLMKFFYESFKKYWCRIQRTHPLRYLWIYFWRNVWSNSRCTFTNMSLKKKILERILMGTLGASIKTSIKRYWISDVIRSL